MYFEKRKSKKAAKGYTWTVKFYYTDTYGTKQRYSKSGFATKAAAEKHGQEMQREIERTGSKPQRVELSQIWTEYKALRFPDLATNTQTSYESAWNKYVAPRFESVDIRAIRYADLQAFFNDLAADLAKGSCDTVKKVLANLYKHAIRSGYVETSPLSLVEVHGKPKEKAAADTATISHEQLDALIEQIENSRSKETRKRALIRFLLIGYYTGLRRGEIIALEKQDFNFETGTVSVTKQIAGGVTTSRLKTAASYAVVPLAAPLADFLRVDLASLAASDLVISDDGITPINPDCVNAVLAQHAKKCGFAFHPHMLRHTFITNLMRSGTDPKTAAQLARHSNIATTLDIYTTMDSADLAAALASAFAEKPQKSPNFGEYSKFTA